MPNKKLTSSKTVKKQVKKTVNHRKIILSGMAVLALLVALLPWQYVFASPTLLVDPYDNISKTGIQTVKVTGAELVPNAEILVEQRSRVVLPAAQGGNVETEYTQVATLYTDADGNLSSTVPVTYDIVVAGQFLNLNYCDTIASENKECTLKFEYGGGGIESGTTLLEQKLYFGMRAPGNTPPPATTPVVKEDCKGDKWKAFGALGIKNQGDCVSYVASKQ